MTETTETKMVEEYNQIKQKENKIIGIIENYLLNGTRQNSREIQEQIVDDAIEVIIAYYTHLRWCAGHIGHNKNFLEEDCDRFFIYLFLLQLDYAKASSAPYYQPDSWEKESFRMESCIGEIFKIKLREEKEKYDELIKEDKDEDTLKHIPYNKACWHGFLRFVQNQSIYDAEETARILRAFDRLHAWGQNSIVKLIFNIKFGEDFNNAKRR